MIGKWLPERGVQHDREVAVQHDREVTAQHDTQTSPVLSSRELLLSKSHGLSGFTYKVDGNSYYLINDMDGTTAVIRTGSGRTSGIEVCPGLGPNKVMIKGLFKFLGNADGTNGSGAKVNIEVYEPFTDEEILIVDPNGKRAGGVRESREYARTKTLPVGVQHEQIVKKAEECVKVGWNSDNPGRSYASIKCLGTMHGISGNPSAYVKNFTQAGRHLAVMFIMPGDDNVYYLQIDSGVKLSGDDTHNCALQDDPIFLEAVVRAILRGVPVPDESTDHARTGAWAVPLCIITVASKTTIWYPTGGTQYSVVK